MYFKEDEYIRDPACRKVILTRAPAAPCLAGGEQTPEQGPPRADCAPVDPARQSSIVHDFQDHAG